MACGAVLWQTTAANLAALAEHAADSQALSRYAEAGRILTGLPSTSSDAAARAGLVEALRTMVRALEVPGLSAFGMTADDIAPVVADSPGSSMRTNPVPLTEAGLARILEAALEAE
jgi:alcohol dehydrogenase